MENSERIKLSTELGLIVAKELKEKYGIDKWKDGSITTFTFTKEELSYIQTLTIKDTHQGDLVGIEHFPSLKSLTIDSSKSRRNLDEYTHPKNIRSINDKDIASIEKCANLESLTIINQPLITEIDLSGMPKLDDVNIIHNMNLEKIHGIDKLHGLTSLTCYGNNSLYEFDGLDKAIIQNREHFDELNLDVLLFPKAIDYKPDGSYNQEALVALEDINGLSRGLNNVKWCENITNHSAVKISHHEMLTMHNKACQILHDICSPTASLPETVLAVEKYLAENVSYDDESLKTGHTKYKDNILDGHKYGSNGAYECLMKSCCVCEGYTRGEQYLLALKGIKTRNVYCIGTPDTLGMADHSKKNDSQKDYILPREGYHSIIYIEGGYGLYSDPCWNACRYQQGDKSLPYSLLTKEEIGKSHTLSFEERSHGLSIRAVTRSQIAQSIERNTLFQKSLTSEVAEQRRVLQQDVIGIIRGKDGKSYQ